MGSAVVVRGLSCSGACGILAGQGSNLCSLPLSPKGSRSGRTFDGAQCVMCPQHSCHRSVRSGPRVAGGSGSGASSWLCSVAGLVSHSLRLVNEKRFSFREPPFPHEFMAPSANHSVWSEPRTLAWRWRRSWAVHVQHTAPQATPTLPAGIGAQWREWTCPRPGSRTLAPET